MYKQIKFPKVTLNFSFIFKMLKVTISLLAVFLITCVILNFDFVNNLLFQILVQFIVILNFGVFSKIFTIKFNRKFDAFHFFVQYRMSSKQFAKTKLTNCTLIKFISQFNI